MFCRRSKKIYCEEISTSNTELKELVNKEMPKEDLVKTIRPMTAPSQQTLQAETLEDLQDVLATI